MQDTPKLWHDSFYRFVKIANPAALVSALTTLCDDAGVLGSILVAEEGINGMLAGTEAQLELIKHELEADGRFADMLYKRTPCSVMPFKRLKVKQKREIVPLGIDGVDATSQTGKNISPEDWPVLISQDDVVLLDNRNSFEVQLGHFRGALDPGVDNFREFAAFVEAHQQEWQDKRVAMYCTGGIRCEKASAWMLELGLDVYQLEGGILNYFARVPNAAEAFGGECFVFDERISLDTRLQETGLERPTRHGDKAIPAPALAFPVNLDYEQKRKTR